MTLILPAEANELERLVDELNKYAVKYIGKVVAENPFKYLKDMQLVDTDAIRHAGSDIWGETSGAGRVGGPLSELSEDLRERLLTTVQDRWQGPAYQQFDQYMRAVERAIEDEVARLPDVGAALVAVADAFEVSWLEIVAWVLAVVSMLVAVIGFLVSVTGFAVGLLADLTGVGAIVGVILGAASLVLALVSLLVAAAGILVTYISSVIPRLDALKDATSIVDDVATAASPVDNRPPAPTTTSDWQRKTANPYN